MKFKNIVQGLCYLILVAMFTVIIYNYYKAWKTLCAYESIIEQSEKEVNEWDHQLHQMTDSLNLKQKNK